MRHQQIQSLPDPGTIQTRDILEALIGWNLDKIWASELPIDGGRRRIDFWTLEPTHSKGFRASAYEIKISRADFTRDSLEKQSGALIYSDRFWYVTPPGLLARQEISDWAGLQEFDGKTFRVVKRAPKAGKAEPSWSFIVGLLRSAGQTQRDTDLMRIQIGALQDSVAKYKRIISGYERRQNGRFLRQTEHQITRRKRNR